MNVENKTPIKKLDWKTTLIMIDELATKIKESGEKFDYIYGIPRGGLIPAVILSHKLGIKLTMNPPDRFFSTSESRYLVIDDISDTGKALYLEKYYEHTKTATLHMRHDTKSKPNFFVEEIKDNTWIQYPWEED